MAASGQGRGGRVCRCNQQRTARRDSHSDYDEPDRTHGNGPGIAGNAPKKLIRAGSDFRRWLMAKDSAECRGKLGSPQ